MRNTIVKILSTIFLLVFCVYASLPCIYFVFGIEFQHKTLYGTYPYTKPKPVLTWESFSSGSYQSQFEEYISNTYFRREYLIEWANLFAIHVLKYVNTSFIQLGRDNVLFERPYIDEATGKNFVGDSVVRENVRRFKLVSDILQSQGKKVLFVMASAKTYYLPDKYYSNFPSSNKTNYYAYAKALKEAGIDFIDINAYFLQLKDTTRYPLYPSAGSHWSQYGSRIAFDTIYKKMELLIQKDIVDYYEIDRELRNESKGIDYDLHSLLNLPIRLKEWPLMYIAHDFDTTGKFRPKLMFVGDSYAWNWFDYSFPQKMFYTKYYYYNHDLYDNTRDATTPFTAEAYVQNINEAEFILILETPANLEKFAFNFGTKMYYQFIKSGQIIDTTLSFDEPYPYPKLKQYCETYLKDWLDKDVNGRPYRAGFEALWNSDDSFKNDLKGRWRNAYYDYMGVVDTEGQYNATVAEGFPVRNFPTFLVHHIKWWHEHLGPI